MNYFLQQHPTLTQNQYDKLISCTTKEFSNRKGLYTLYTFKPKVKKNQTEDTLFVTYPFLVKMLPRACTYVIKDGLLLTKMEGCYKFTGYTNVDEDPENQTESIGTNNTHLFDYNEIEHWNQQQELEIIMTEKANGKFVICQLFDECLVYGSKNNHELILLDEIYDTIERYKQSYSSHHFGNELLHSILYDLFQNMSKIQLLSYYFQEGYSLVGELCDGKHFSPGNNTIQWFGLFHEGKCLETMQALTTLQTNGLQTVSFWKASWISNQLSSVFTSARCLSGEGYVLRCRNIRTNEIRLVKVKAVGYIIKRFLRQLLLMGGYKRLYQLTQRFIDASQYHQLNTDASVRLTNQLFSFAQWMMSEKLPVSILGIIEETSDEKEKDKDNDKDKNDSNQLPMEHGFSNCWEYYLQTTGNPDLRITLHDFEGIFDTSLYLKNIQWYPLRQPFEPATVLFFQGLPGMGKTEIAKYLCITHSDFMYIEQDMFWGDTLACQGALYHAIANQLGPKYIIVSRCNLNESHYAKYMDICLSLPAIPLFFTPNQLNETDLLLSLQGIFIRTPVEQRQQNQYQLGKKKMTWKQILTIVYDGYKNYQPHPNGYIIHWRNQETNEQREIHKEMISYFLQNKDLSFHEIEKYIQQNNLSWIYCHHLHLSLENIKKQIISYCIERENTQQISCLSSFFKSKPIYIGWLIHPKDQIQLHSFINQYIPNGTLFNHHITYLYKPTESQLQSCEFLPYSSMTITIHECILRKKKENMKEYDAGAFLVTFPSSNPETSMITSNYHITSKIPSHEKPFISNSFIRSDANCIVRIPFSFTLDTVFFYAK